MKLRHDIDSFLAALPGDVTLVAASKYVDAPVIENMYQHGIRNFGENRVEAFLEKREALKELSLTWHFIGHLQRNKALDVINKIDYLHSLDSLKLADIIEKNCQKSLKVFIEVSINEEENKNGVKVSELDEFVSKLLKYSKIELVGLMMMSIKYSDEKSLNEQFAKLKQVKKHLTETFKISLPFLSMGMSDDYLEAISQGATHIRLGRILFEE